MEHVSLVPMDNAQFKEFLEILVPPYAAERATADHVSLEDAERFAVDQLTRLLPDGQQTASHSFLAIVPLKSTQWAGGVWFQIEAEFNQAFLYNITIFPRYRRKGFARDALMQLEVIARNAGCSVLGLNVFTNNSAALALYRKVGFSAVSNYLSKAL